MSTLAQFLATERKAIIDLFVERTRSNAAPGSTHRQLVDHLPDFLMEVVSALGVEAGPRAHRAKLCAWSQAHGRQRTDVGYDLDALVREYGILRDCVFERLELGGVAPKLHELRIFSECISTATSNAVHFYVETRQGSLEAERHHLLGLFQQAPGFVCFLRGRDLVFELANQAYFQLVGHRDILGRPARQAMPEIEGQGYFELLDGVLRSGQPVVGRSMGVSLQREPNADLTRAFIDFVFQPIVGADGTVIGILVQGHDVTETKRQEDQREAAEVALRASEERYRTLFASIDDGYALVQLIFDEADRPCDYLFLETNAAFEHQTGLACAMGRRARELVPDLDESWYRIYGHVALSGAATRFDNYAPAMQRWFEVYASRVGAPELRQVAIVFKDISDRRRAEAERERLFRLESDARKQAEEASRLKDEFLATLSHELRTPLNSMLGWLHLLRGGKLPVDKHERALETVDRNARSQAQLIDDLLDVSRILAGKLRLEAEPLELRSAVEAALETVRPAAEAKHITLSAALASECMVLGDSNRLQQVVWNLISNAVKFTPKGGRVDVRLESEDDSATLSVSDTGRGISPAFLPYVFERFRQQDGGATRAHGGLGLGLSIVRHLVELHGGTVLAASEGEGRGSTFSVRLPVAAAKHKSAPPVSADALLHAELQRRPELEGLSVLIVDDEDDSREMLRATLEQCGCRVRAADSAAACRSLFAQEPPDVLLSDIGMPDEDGYALMRSIRALSASRGGHVPAVALTTYARTQDRTRALLAGFDHHVPKPLEPTELLAVVASLAGMHLRCLKSS